MKTQVDSYIETYTGKKFYVLDPQPDQIDIIDIAHAMSMNCRYTGHCMEFYSIAEHSVYTSQLVSAPNKLWALLHDASEAYLTDVASPVKPHLHNYKELEKNIMKAICEKYNLPIEMPSEVHISDVEILRKEASVLMRSGGKDWLINTTNSGPLVDIEIQCLSPLEAKMLFLETFYDLTREIK
jgi:hypothetical protein